MESKYKVEFKNSYDKTRIISYANTIKECWDIIFEFLEDHNYKSYYQRTRIGDDGKVHIDVGSWSEFFYISRTNGEKITWEEVHGVSYPCRLNQIKECDACGACQEQESETLCECCEEPITDYYYKIGGEVLCEKCMNDMYRREVE